MSPPKIWRKYQNFIFRQEEVCHLQKIGGSVDILFSNRRKYVATKILKSDEVCHILEKQREYAHFKI